MKTIKLYHLIKNHGNDEVIPEPETTKQYQNGEITWKGFEVTYLGKLMKTEAEKWMRRVSTEAINEDVVLVSDEEDNQRCFRILLAKTMVNMFSGHMKLHYSGELK